MVPVAPISPAPSSASLPPLPWEMLAHIFSYCDQPTLCAVSLVSFACWELAGPILYEEVEIRSMDGLFSLFFLPSFPSSDRFRLATSHLSRIKTLSLEIHSWDQRTTQPFFLDPELWEGPEYDSDDDSREATDLRIPHGPLLVPHRLQAFTLDPLPLHTVRLPNWKLYTYELQGFLPLQVFPYLNPRQLVHPLLDGPTRGRWHGYITSVPPGLLQHWDNLERITMEGQDLVCMHMDEEGEYDERPMYWLWAKQRGQEEGEEGRRSLELVYDFEVGARDHVEAEEDRIKVGSVLDHGGCAGDAARWVDLRLVVRVRRDDEALMREEIKLELREEVRKLVTIELV